MRVIFFDLEWDNPVDKNIISLAYEVWDNRQCMQAVNTLILPICKLNITEAAYAIHGITEQQLTINGRDCVSVMEEFIRSVETANILVAHGVKHDILAIIKLSMQLDIMFPPHKLLVCTKLLGTAFCMLPHVKAGLKWPTLQEFFMSLFGFPFEGWHNAVHDVAACRSCYFRLMDMRQEMESHEISVAS